MTPETTDTRTDTPQKPLSPEIQQVLDEHRAKTAEDMQRLAARLIMTLLTDPVWQAEAMNEMIPDATVRAQLIDELTKEPDTHLTLPYRLLLIAIKKCEEVFADPTRMMERHASTKAVEAAITNIREHNNIVHPARKL